MIEYTEKLDNENAALKDELADVLKERNDLAIENARLKAELARRDAEIKFLRLHITEVLSHIMGKRLNEKYGAFNARKTYISTLNARAIGVLWHELGLDHEYAEMKQEQRP